MKIPQVLGAWFGGRGQPTVKRDGLRLSCHGCMSEDIEMIVPMSPEVLSYRCTKCGREWSSRAPVKGADDPPS